jgi:preprotein translocase subunit SecA
VLHRGRIAEMKTGEGKTLVATMTFNCGGMVLHSGRIAEMKTGEGKTLPAYLS